MSNSIPSKSEIRARVEELLQQSLKYNRELLRITREVKELREKIAAADHQVFDADPGQTPAGE